MKKEYDFSKAKRGAIDPTPAGKTKVTLRLDDEILQWFRNQVHNAGGGNYEVLINNVLQIYIAQQQEPLETVLRRVVREKLQQAITLQTAA